MTALQVIWFLLVGVLFIGYAILDGFDLGVGFWHLGAKGDDERRSMLNSVGPVWDGNEVWLLTAGGALFGAFPAVYASVFSGFYLALMLVLLVLMARAISFEFRSQVESPGWRGAWDVVFSISSVVAILLFGVALGNILRGIPLDVQIRLWEKPCGSVVLGAHKFLVSADRTCAVSSRQVICCVSRQVMCCVSR